MASHSVIKLPKKTPTEDVEAALTAINQRRFGGRFRIARSEELTRSWDSACTWLIEAPNTRPKEPGPCFPDEDEGFCLWLHKGGRGIESRHAAFNAWTSWVQHIFEHELAKHFGIQRFDTGDGLQPTDPEQFKNSLYAFATRNWTEPLTESDEDFIRRRFTDYIPEGWERCGEP